MVARQKIIFKAGPQRVVKEGGTSFTIPAGVDVLEEYDNRGNKSATLVRYQTAPGQYVTTRAPGAITAPSSRYIPDEYKKAIDSGGRPVELGPRARQSRQAKLQRRAQRTPIIRIPARSTPSAKTKGEERIIVNAQTGRAAVIPITSKNIAAIERGRQAAVKQRQTQKIEQEAINRTLRDLKKVGYKNVQRTSQGIQAERDGRKVIFPITIGIQNSQKEGSKTKQLRARVGGTIVTVPLSAKVNLRQLSDIIERTRKAQVRQAKKQSKSLKPILEKALGKDYKIVVPKKEKLTREQKLIQRQAEFDKVRTDITSSIKRRGGYFSSTLDEQERLIGIAAVRTGLSILQFANNPIKTSKVIISSLLPQNIGSTVSGLVNEFNKDPIGTIAEFYLISQALKIFRLKKKKIGKVTPKKMKASTLALTKTLQRVSNSIKDKSLVRKITRLNSNLRKRVLKADIIKRIVSKAEIKRGLYNARRLRTLPKSRRKLKLRTIKKNIPETLAAERAALKLKKRTSALNLEKERTVLRRQQRIEQKLAKGQQVKTPRFSPTTKGYPFEDLVTGKIRYFKSRKKWLRAVKQQVKGIKATPGVLKALKEGRRTKIKNALSSGKANINKGKLKAIRRKAKRQAQSSDALINNVKRFRSKIIQELRRDSGPEILLNNFIQYTSAINKLRKRGTKGIPKSAVSKFRKQVKPLIKPEKYKEIKDATQKQVLLTLEKKKTKAKTISKQLSKIKPTQKQKLRQITITISKEQKKIQQLTTLATKARFPKLKKVLNQTQRLLTATLLKARTKQTQAQKSEKLLATKAVSTRRTSLRRLASSSQTSLTAQTISTLSASKAAQAQRTRQIVNTALRSDVISRTAIKQLLREKAKQKPPIIKPEELLKKKHEIKKKINAAVAKKKFIYLPDLAAAILGEKASKSERGQLLRAGRIFTGQEARRLV